MTSHTIPDPAPTPPLVGLPDLLEDGKGRFSFNVAGVSFRDGYPDNLLALSPDFPDSDVLLIAAPDNPYDSNAWEVWVRPSAYAVHYTRAREYSTQIGFVPKAYARSMTTLAGEGFRFRVIRAEVLAGGDLNKVGVSISAEIIPPYRRSETD